MHVQEIGRNSAKIEKEKSSNKVIYIAGTLGLVNHRGIYQGWTQTSICLQVILHTCQ